MRLSDEFPWGPSPAKAPNRLFDGERSRRTEASVAWFLQSTDIDHAGNGVAVQADFDVSASAVEASFRTALDRFAPDVVFAVNGLFAAERTMCEVAADRGVRTVTYEVSPRKGALVLGQSSPAPEMVMDGLAEDQCSQPLSREEGEALDGLLYGRVTGAESHERYFDTDQQHEGETVRASLGIDSRRRVISAFTNLAWDTALLGKDIAFESQFDWLARAAEFVSPHDDVVLVIRVHPAESRWGSGQPVEAELAARLGQLPRNVCLVRSDDSTSSYGLLAISDLALCYTTTVGLEAAVRGITVAVAGKTHYRGRGFTLDIESRTDLERVISDPPTMKPDQVELARRYAFAFFFRRMVPFGHLDYESGRLGPIVVSAEDLLPGQDPYLDFLCDRIMEGGEFFLPSSLALADRTKS
jgi:hypothetical protein